MHTPAERIIIRSQLSRRKFTESRSATKRSEYAGMPYAEADLLELRSFEQRRLGRASVSRRRRFVAEIRWSSLLSQVLGSSPCSRSFTQKKSILLSDFTAPCNQSGNHPAPRHTSRQFRSDVKPVVFWLWSWRPFTSKFVAQLSSRSSFFLKRGQYSFPECRRYGWEMCVLFRTSSAVFIFLMLGLFVVL